MKKYIKPAVKRIEMGQLCDDGMPEISIYNQQGDEGGFANEDGLFEEETDIEKRKNIAKMIATVTIKMKKY